MNDMFFLKDLYNAFHGSVNFSVAKALDAVRDVLDLMKQYRKRYALIRAHVLQGHIQLYREWGSLHYMEEGKRSVWFGGKSCLLMMKLNPPTIFRRSRISSRSDFIPRKWDLVFPCPIADKRCQNKGNCDQKYITDS